MTKAPEMVYIAGDISVGEGCWTCCFEKPKRGSGPMLTYIRADLADHDAIRNAALREAAELVASTEYVSHGDDRYLQRVSPVMVGVDMHHATIAAAILNLIDKKETTTNA